MDLDRVFSRVNPAIAAVLRSPLHWPLSTGLLLLTVTGRRSGRRYTIPVGYQPDAEGFTVMVSKARRKQWWRNYLDPGPAEVCVRGKRRLCQAWVVGPATEEFQRRAEQTLRRMPWLGRQFGIEYDRQEGLGNAQLERLRAEIAIVRVVPTAD